MGVNTKDRENGIYGTYIYIYMVCIPLTTADHWIRRGEPGDEALPKERRMGEAMRGVGEVSAKEWQGEELQFLELRAYPQTKRTKHRDTRLVMSGVLSQSI